MVKLEKAVVARFEFSGEKFEVLVDPDLAFKLKQGEQVSFNELLAADTVFKDAHKGNEASPESLTKSFGTTDVQEITKKIILKGEVQLTTDQRKKFVEQKRKEIIDFISRNAVNPQANAPHPPQRIDNALNEAKITIDPMKSVAEQVNKIIPEIRKLIPISMEKLSIAVRIPSMHAGKAASMLHRSYKILKEEWQSDGSLIALIELPAGLKQELLGELSKITHGEVESKIVKSN